MMINATETQKLLNVGLTVINGRYDPASGLSIWQKTKDKREWHLFEKGFASKAALKRRIGELAKDPMTVDIYDSFHTI